MSLFIFLDDDEWKKIIYILNHQTVVSSNEELDNIDDIKRKIKHQTGL